jgi:hypothetical protein
MMLDLFIFLICYYCFCTLVSVASNECEGNAINGQRRMLTYAALLIVDFNIGTEIISVSMPWW